MNETTTTLAEQFLIGTLSDNGTHHTASNEFEFSVCGHTAGCPCAGKLVNATLDYYVFADESVYVDGLGVEKVFANDDDMWDWFISDDAAERVRDEY